MRKIIGSFVPLLALLVIVSCESQEKAKKNSLPNIVIIVSDDQGYGDFGCFGNEVLSTPNLDSLFSQSVHLKNFYVSPVCSPSRASLLTGRYNFRTGVWDTWKGWDMLHPEETTIAELLAPLGYATGLFGKWHLGINAPCRPQDQGFQTTYTWDGISRFDPTMIENGVEKTEKGFLDDLIFDKAIDFIEQNKDSTFLAYIPSYLPHTHFSKQVPDSYVNRFNKYEDMTQGDKEVYAMVEKFDENVGRFMKKLADLNLDENTIVVFLSDNGPAFSAKRNMTKRYNLNLRGSKGKVYQGGIKVPCFIRWTGTLNPTTIEGNTAHIDIAPTILGLINKSASSSVRMDGMDLSDILHGKTEIPERYLYQQLDRNNIPLPNKNYAVIGSRFKLVNDELYDLVNDPSESENLSKQLPDKVLEFGQAYSEWFEDVTNERPFEPVHTLVGVERQRITTLFHTKIHDTRKYPVEIMGGVYTLLFEEVQPQIFGAEGQLGIRLDSLVYISPVKSDNKNLIIENVRLPNGRFDLDIVTIDKDSVKFSYGNEDLGFRKLKIIKENK